MNEPVWIGLGEALALHGRVLARHGGPDGVRDLSLLESALARPRQMFSYKDSVDLTALAAAYTFGIVRNHPFTDGNKRAGFVVGVLFLELNGLRFRASQAEAANAVIALAAETMEEAAYAAFLRANVG